MPVVPTVTPAIGIKPVVVPLVTEMPLLSPSFAHTAVAVVGCTKISSLVPEPEPQPHARY
jgi:hypothetical protein